MILKQWLTPVLLIHSKFVFNQDSVIIYQTGRWLKSIFLSGIRQLCRMGSERHRLCGRWLRHSARWDFKNFFYWQQCELQHLLYGTPLTVSCESFCFSSQALRCGYISLKIKGETAEEKVGPVFVYSASCNASCLSVDGVTAFCIDLWSFTFPLVLFVLSGRINEFHTELKCSRQTLF